MKQAPIFKCWLVICAYSKNYKKPFFLCHFKYYVSSHHVSLAKKSFNLGALKFKYLPKIT